MSSPTTNGAAPTSPGFGSPYVQDVSVSIYPLQQHLNEDVTFPDNSIKTSKYTIITFIPKNLFEQFRKVSNFYFLLTALVSTIPGASPVNPAANILPLMFVVGVSMIKDGLEDFLRHRADERSNSTLTTVLKPGGVKFVKVRSKEVKVGDILCIAHNEEIRADCILLNSSHPEGIAYIDTANLDGESSLKSKKSKFCTVENLGTIDLLIAMTQPELKKARAKAAAEEEEQAKQALEAENMKFYGSKAGGGSRANLNASRRTSRAISSQVASLEQSPAAASEPLSLPSVEHHSDGTPKSNKGIPAYSKAPAAVDNLDKLDLGVPEINSGANSPSGTTPSGKTRKNPGNLSIITEPPPQQAVASQAGEKQEIKSVVKEAAVADDNSTSSDGIPFPPIIMGSPAHPNLDAWKGQARIRGTPYPLGIDQFLYRGAVLRNTDWAIALVAYAGVDSKMFLNLQQKPSKLSSLDVKMNYVIATVFLLNQCLVILLCSMSVLWWTRANDLGPKSGTGRRGFWYIQPDLDFYNGPGLFFWYYMGYFVLLSYMIPVSLFVTMEINKATQATLMLFDQEMMFWDTVRSEWRGCHPRTSGINEQLALVQFIFTDKTGTLTENVMKYVGGLIGDKEYVTETDGVNGLGVLAAEGRKANRAARTDEGESQRMIAAPIPVTPRTGGGLNDDDADDNIDRMQTRTRSPSPVDEPVQPHSTTTVNTATTMENVSLDVQTPTVPPPPAAGSSLLKRVDSVAAAAVTPPARNQPDYDDEYPDYLDDLPSLYLMAMATCHGVICFKEGTKVIYDGQSPDEIAFVQAAKENGFTLSSRNSNLMEVEIEGEDFSRTFEILAELEFDATRKMMSILLKDAQTDVNILFTKGADTSIIAHSAPSDHNKEYIPRLDDNLHRLGEIGYRTLLIGCRVVSEEEAEIFKEGHHQACCSMGDRDAELRELYKTLEHSLELVGSTGVEDKLQEEVPETIQFCLNAKMVVWMLTGDKRETAVTIAATSRLLHPQTQAIAHIDTSTMNHSTEEAMMLVATEAFKQLREAVALAKAGETVLVIDGKSLGTILSEEIGGVPEFADMLTTFIDLGFIVVSGVCCRLTPLQKAEIVKIFQTKTKATALAIGDGANDVSMIQEGKVGIGIMGREGSQAELAADYAIPKFRHLKRLMFVHGRDAYYRNTGCITFSLYKNMTLALTLGLYGFFNGFTGLPLFESWTLSMYNTLFCMAPPTFWGMCERDVSPEIALKYAYLFPPLAKWQYFNIREVGFWVMDFLGHSFFLFWVGWSTFAGQNTFAGDNGSLDYESMYLYIPLVILINLRMGLMIKTWTWFQFSGIFISISILFLFETLYNIIPGWAEEFFGVFFASMRDVRMYLFMFLIDVGLILVYNATRDYLRMTASPPLTHVARNTEEELEKEKSLLNNKGTKYSGGEGSGHEMKKVTTVA